VTAPHGRPLGGLGRGLGALIPTAPPVDRPVDEPVDPVDDGGASLRHGARFAELPLDAIRPNPSQPRVAFDEEALAELGHLDPRGRPAPAGGRASGGPGQYELVMGERRWRASQEAGTATIPAIVRETADADMLRDALLENLHRSALNPLEEAAAYAQLLEDFGATHEELATRIGRSRPQISNTIRLLQLPAAVQRRVAAGVLSAGHARAVLGLPTPQAQEAMATRIVAEGLSVRGTEEAVALAVAADPAQERSPRGTRRRPVPSRLVEVADRLSDRFETRVKVDLGRSKGKVVIEFASVDDLERIVQVIEGPPTPDRRDGRETVSRGRRPCSSRLRSTCPNDRSAASTAIGSSDVSVMPGEVLTSRSCTRPWASTTASTRETSRRPRAVWAATAASATAAAAGSRGGPARRTRCARRCTGPCSRRRRTAARPRPRAGPGVRRRCR
jgi:ParB family chromosome partitioning protein